MSAVGIDRKSDFERRMSRFAKIMGEALSPLKKELIAMPFGDFGWGNVKGSKDEDLKQVPKLVGISAGILGSVYLFAKTDWTKVAYAALATTAAVGGLGAAGLAGYLTLYNKLYKVRADRDMRYVRIVPHANTKTTTDGVNHLIKSLWRSYRPKLQRLIRGREWFQLLFSCEEGENDRGDISIYLGFPQDRWSFLIQTIKSVYPTSELVEVAKDQIPVFNQSRSQGKGRVLTWRDEKQSGFPLQSFEEEKISKVLEHLETGCTLSITFSPTTHRKLKKSTKRTRKYLYKITGFNPKESSISQLDADVQDELRQLKYRERTDSNPFEVSISIYDKEGRDYTIESVTNALNSVVSTQNSLKHTWAQFNQQPIQYAPQFLPLPRLLNNLMVWTGEELANLVHLPNGKDREARQDSRPHIYDRIPHVMAGQSLLPKSEFTEGIRVGEYINPGQENRPIFFPEEQLRSHAILLGKAGGGKTATALEMATHLLEKRLNQPTGGFTLIDPKATFAKNMLTRINKMKLEGSLKDEGLNYIHYFDLTSNQYSFGLNPLERPNNQPPNRSQAEKIIERTLDVMRAAWSNESILFERFGRLLLKALLADPYEQHTLLALPEVLRENSSFRTTLIQRLKQGNRYSQEIARDLEEEEKKGGFEKKTDPLINRLVRIKESTTLRRIFGQKRTSIDPLKWMNEGHICIFNTEGLDQDLATILLGYIVYEYHRQCRKRKNPNQNHYLIVDEAHNLKGLDVLHKKVIPEDREFGLSLFLMTQAIHQFPEPFFEALTEIAGTYMSCQAGTENARIIDKVTQGRISADTVQGLKTLTTAIEATDSKKNRVSFIVKVPPPVVYDKNGNPTYYGPDGDRTSREKQQAFEDCYKLIGQPLMERDCTSADQVEREIDEYIASLSPQVSQVSAEELIQKAKTPSRFNSRRKPNKKRLIIPKQKKHTGGGDVL